MAQTTYLFKNILQGVMVEMTIKLEKSMAQRNKTQKTLDCTRTVLHKHESFGQAQKLFQNIENECKLRQQAQLLLTVSDEATKIGQILNPDKVMEKAARDDKLDSRR